MKKLIFATALIGFSLINAHAQVVPVITTTLTPGSGDFLVDKSHYPFNSLVLYIVASDTSKVGLNYTLTGGSFITAKQRVKYIDGRTGQPFASIGRLKQFYDSFMVSPPFTTTIAGDLNILGDATAANQASEISDLDSLLKYQTNKGVTATHLAIAGTLDIPLGSILIAGTLDATGAGIAVTDITGETAIEQRFLSVLPPVPMQSYRALATAHTITAVAACTVFVLKLH